MIRWPKPGQRVELHYRKETRDAAPHLATGTVVKSGRGRGPINALILLDDGRAMVVPHGQLMLCERSESDG